VISAIGNNGAESVAALQSGKSGIGPITHLETVHRDEFPVGEVRLPDAELAQQLGLKETVSRTALLSLAAAKEALEDAGLANSKPLRMGFISANSVGGMDRTEDFYGAFLQDRRHGRLRNVVTTNAEVSRISLPESWASATS
jgi:3-oxoacyl-[acyl-carrier-protein] synthase-1